MNYCTFKGNRKIISDFVKRAYLAYFGVRLVDQDKSWAPQHVWQTYVEHTYNSGVTGKETVYDPLERAPKPKLHR